MRGETGECPNLRQLLMRDQGHWEGGPEGEEGEEGGDQGDQGGPEGEKGPTRGVEGEQELVSL